jgi:hypothetical protein
MLDTGFTLTMPHARKQESALSRSLFIALMTEALSTSKTSVSFYQNTPRTIPEDSHLH